MNYGGITLFSTLKSRLEYSSERQAVLAKNVANIDTPGFSMVDLKPLKMDKIADSFNSHLTARKTNPLHMDGKRNSGSHNATGNVKTYETKPVGNNVSIEEMMMKVSENNYDYNEALNLYSKTVQMMKAVIK